MFGCVISSRPVVTELQTISETQYAFNVPASPPFNHVAIFLLPGQTLPATHAAAVYVQLPPSQDFRLLGALGAQKPSAIFKISGQVSTTAHSMGAGAGQAGGGDDLMVDDATLQPPAGNGNGNAANIVIGISIEPVQSVEQQLAQLKAGQTSSSAVAAAAVTGSELVRHVPGRPQQVTPPKILAQRIIKNAFNFLSSFAIRQGGEDVVTMKRFQEWWTKFEKRLEIDPEYLEKEQG